MSRALGLLALAGALAGCATYVWTKPGVTPELAVRDDTECRAQARDLAFEYAFSRGLSWGPGPWGPLWSRDPFWWHDPLADPGWRFEVEQRVYDRCMAFKGYELTEVPK
jgi:hypothetical protein